MCVCDIKNPQSWGTGPHPHRNLIYTASILLHEMCCIMRQANQMPGPKTRDRTTQCTIKRQTITTLRRVSASGLTGSGWPLDRLVPLQHPAPHSKARVCLRGERKRKESAKGLRWLLYVVTCIGFFECLYTAVSPPIPKPNN